MTHDDIFTLASTEFYDMLTLVILSNAV